jgi:hypothetical protein
MARTEEAEAFFFAVYQAIQEVPHGKVTSYAHIARLVGTRKYLLPSSFLYFGDSVILYMTVIYISILAFISIFYSKNLNNHRSVY